MNTQESASNRNWRKIAIPTTLVAGIAAGALFGPVGVASADDSVTEAEATEESTTDDTSSDERSEEKAAKKAERAEAMAAIFGISTDEYEAGRDEGKTLAELAEENDVERDQLVSSLTELAEARIDQAVADEKIDEDKAAELREGLAEKIENKIDQAPGEGKNGSNRGAKDEGKNGSNRGAKDEGKGRSDRGTRGEGSSERGSDDSAEATEETKEVEESDAVGS